MFNYYLYRMVDDGLDELELESKQKDEFTIVTDRPSCS